MARIAINGLGRMGKLLVRALAESLNMATVRLGLELGLPSVIDVLGRLGVRTEIPPYPSLLLGAIGGTCAADAPGSIQEPVVLVADERFTQAMRRDVSAGRR